MFKSDWEWQVTVTVTVRHKCSAGCSRLLETDRVALYPPQTATQELNSAPVRHSNIAVGWTFNWKVSWLQKTDNAILKDPFFSNTEMCFQHCTLQSSVIQFKILNMSSIQIPKSTNIGITSKRIYSGSCQLSVTMGTLRLLETEEKQLFPAAIS